MKAMFLKKSLCNKSYIIPSGNSWKNGNYDAVSSKATSDSIG